MVLLAFFADPSFACQHKSPVVMAPTFVLRLKGSHLTVAHLPVVLQSDSKEIKNLSDGDGKARFEDVPYGAYRVLLPVGWVKEEIEVTKDSKRSSAALKVVQPDLFKASALTVSLDVQKWIRGSTSGDIDWRVRKLSNGIPMGNPVGESDGEFIDLHSVSSGTYLVEVTLGAIRAPFLLEVNSKNKNNNLTLQLAMTTCGPYWKRTHASSH